MYRIAYEKLMSWKDKQDRKPLIMSGVRQCGKTYILKEFGERNYDNTVYLNFEGNDELIRIFEPNLDVDRILSQLTIFSGERIDPGRTLIIFDEIQFCNRALTSLKYFYENAPGYHIACAGSLLGILMSRPHSFPVGKVDRIDMYPMNFKEFLIANGEDRLVNEMDGLHPTDPSISPFTARLESHLDTFLTIGGMPAAVDSWLRNRDIGEVDDILENIIRDYRNDFSKHAAGSTQKLTLIWDSIPQQLARESKKFIFSHVKSGARARDLEDALEWLIDAGLVYKITSVDPPKVPLPIYADNSKFKIYLADVGIFRRMSGVDSDFMFNDSKDLDHFKGAITENFVLNELISSGTVPFYWTSKGIAEVDFIIQSGRAIIPIEVKSGHKTNSKSMYEFIRKFEPKIAVITSLDIGMTEMIRKVPLYWAWRIPSLSDTV